MVSTGEVFAMEFKPMLTQIWDFKASDADGPKTDGAFYSTLYFLGTFGAVGVSADVLALATPRNGSESREVLSVRGGVRTVTMGADV